MTVPLGRERVDVPHSLRASVIRRGVKRRSPITLLSLIAVAALLAGCGSATGSEPARATDPDDTTTSDTKTAPAPSRESPDAPPDTPVATPVPGSPGFAENTAPQNGRSSKGAMLVLTDVRVAEHASFDRIVLEFSGAGTPGWQVKYVDEAVLDGSGDVVGLAGNATLDIYATGTTWPAPDYYTGPSRPEVTGGRVAGLFVAGTFEGYTQVLAGIHGAATPFRVVALTEPARLVVDILG